MYMEVRDRVTARVIGSHYECGLQSYCLRASWRGVGRIGAGGVVGLGPGGGWEDGRALGGLDFCKHIWHGWGCGVRRWIELSLY